jgi:hypothetical protein
MNKPYYIEDYIANTFSYLYPKNKSIEQHLFLTIHILLPIVTVLIICIMLLLGKKQAIYMIILFTLVTLYWNVYEKCPYNDLVYKYFNISLPILPVRIKIVKYISNLLLIVMIIFYLIRR